MAIQIIQDGRCLPSWIMEENVFGIRDYVPDIIPHADLSLLFTVISTGQTVASSHTLNGCSDVFPHKEVPFWHKDRG